MPPRIAALALSGRETEVDRSIRCKLRSRGIDHAIGELARRQHGLVARRQVLALGLSRTAIDTRIRHGRLVPVHRGVYAVGHAPLSAAARWMGGVLATGPDAVLTHEPGSALWRLTTVDRARVPVVTVPRKVSRRPGLRVHVAVLPFDEVTVVDGIPVTIVPRTILDLAAVRPRDVERAIKEAEYRRLYDRLSLWDVLARYPGRRGSRTVREILEDNSLGVGITRSELERRFLTFLDEVGLPRPDTNASVEVRPGASVEADIVWRRQRVVVELDGRAAHATAHAFEADRARDRALTVAGWRPVRITWRQLQRHGGDLAADLHTLLTRDRS